MVRLLQHKSKFIVGLIIVIFLIAVGSISFVPFGIIKFAHIVVSTGGTSFKEVFDQVSIGVSAVPNQTNNRKNILVLGTDAVSNRPNAPVLTDTILLVSISLDSGKVTLISFPRDLWDSKYQTKINALYSYGEEFYPGQPEQLTTEVISELTQLEIHHTLIVSLDMLAQVIDAVGGVEVSIPESFIDTQFPRDDVDIMSKDPTVLHETVSFEAGTELLSSDRALKYIRSRKSATDQGTDIARGERQQQVIIALVKRLTSKQVLLDPYALGILLRWYTMYVEDQLPLSEAIATARLIFPNRNTISFTTHTLSIYSDSELGVIEHPDPSLYQDNWVYVVRDLVALRKEIQTYLGDL